MCNRLRNLMERLKPLQDAAEGAAPHLLDHVTAKTLTTRKHLRDILAADFEACLAKILWPKPGVELPAALQHDWRRSALKLLDLQRAELEADGARAVSTSDDRSEHQTLVLLPFEVMAQPLQARFTYHFSGSRPTNRLDKPEYFLSHTIDLLNTHADFVADTMQPVLSHFFAGTPTQLDPAYLDATGAFITALLPMLRAKLTALLPSVENQPKLFSHLIHQLLDFDTTIRTDWHYSPPSSGPGPDSSDGAAIPWPGLTAHVLTTHALFPHYLELEKSFALARYQSIVDDASNASLDPSTASFPSSSSSTLSRTACTPPRAAELLHDLLTSVTDIYRRLPCFSHQLRFLMDIQIALLDRYHARLHQSLEAHHSLASTLGRTVHAHTHAVSSTSTPSASTPDSPATAVPALDRIVRVLGAADHLERAMRAWSNDAFFLALWRELQRRTAAGITTATGPSPLDAGALFDETAAAYARLRSRAEHLLSDALCASLRDALRPYARLAAWSSLATPAASMPGAEAAAEPSTSTKGAATVTPAPAPSPTLPPSPELAPLLAQLHDSLGQLAATLAVPPLRRACRAASRALEVALWERVLLPHTFSEAGAAQLAADVGALRAAFVEALGLDGTEGMRGIVEAVRLLGMPVASSSSSSSDDGPAPKSHETAGLTLGEVEHRLFSDNESAREVLEELGMQVLTEGEARKVLERRIELGA